MVSVSGFFFCFKTGYLRLLFLKFLAITNALAEKMQHKATGRRWRPA